MEWCSLRLAADGQLYLIIGRQRERTLRRRAGIKRAGNLYWIVIAQIPREPIHSFICWNRFSALDAIWRFGWLLAFFLLLLERCLTILPEASRISSDTSSFGAVLK